MMPQAGSIPAMLAAQAAERPSAVALWRKRYGLWKAMTYGELRDRVAAVAAGLAEAGVTSGTPVAVVGENSPEWVVADLAVQSLGAQSIALAPQVPADVAARVLASAGAQVVVAGDQEQVDLVLDAGDRLAAVRAIVVVDATGTERYDDPRLRTLADVEAAGRGASPQPGAEGGAVVMLSAGASGDPRPAVHAAAAVAEAARNAASWLQLSPEDRNLCALSLANPSARILDLYAPLAAGAQIAVPEAPATVAEDIREAAPTVLTVSPRALELLRQASRGRSRESSRLRRRAYGWAMEKLQKRLDARDGARTVDGARKGRGLPWLLVGRFVADELGASKLRRIAVAGGAVLQPDARFFWGLGIPVLETYGQAALLGPVLAQASLDDAGTAGRPLPGVQARVGADGVLEVASAATGGDWRSTGDLAEQAGEDRIRVRGRREDVVQTSAGEVVVAGLESALCDSAYIRRAVVAPVQRRLTAIVEVDRDETSRWAAERDLTFSTYGSLVALPEVAELVAAEVAAANERIGLQAGIDDFVMVPEPLSVAAGELTADLAVRRGAVIERHATDAPAMRPDAAGAQAAPSAP